MRMKTGTTLAALLLAGCAGYEYRDTNAAVDRDPACASRADRPGEPVSLACERKAEAKWNVERKDAAPIDFSGKPRDD